MRAKKIFIPLLVLLFSTLLVSAMLPLSKSMGKSINNELANSLKDCKNEKRKAYPICRSNYYETRNECKTKYNECKTNTEEYSDKIACKIGYMSCLITINYEKRICRKNVINNYKQCKKESREKKTFCMTLYDPVCGIDDQTYSNLCVLDLTGVEKACDSECPCGSNAAQTGKSADVVNPVCGNGICEQGEADEYDPGGCGPGADPRCLGPPASFRQGTCPQDC